jgi:ABC-2 type transport system permease protein
VPTSPSRRSPAARARSERLAELPFESFGVARRGFVSTVVTSVAEIWQRRELLGQLVRRELKVRYKDSTLGFLWAMIRPITMLVIYYVAIGKFLGAERTIPEFAIFVFTGLTLWGFYQETITQATASILTNAGLVKKVYLPRALFPLASAGSALVNFGIQLFVLVAAIIALGQYPDPLRLLYAPAAFAVTFIFAVALGILLSALNVYLRDVQYLVEVALLIFFWASPIVYSWQLVSEQLSGPLEWMREVYLANPITVAIIAFQRALWAGGADQAVPPFLELRLAIMAVVGLIVLWIAQRTFARLQGNFAQEI